MNHRIVRLGCAALAVLLIAIAGHAAEDAPSLPLFESPLDLLVRLPVARVGLDDASLGDLPMDSADHFAGGWYQLSETDNGQLYRWMGPRVGLVDVALVEAEELTVSLGVTTPRDDLVPPMRVRFHWNGAFAGFVDLPGEPATVQMVIPAELTRPGLNRLELFPSFWVDASRLAGGSSATNVSINVYRLAITRSAGAAKRIRALRPIAQPGGRVQQRANSVVTWATRVGPDATLEVAGEWLADSDGVEPANALVLVRDASGRTEVAFEADSSVSTAPFDRKIDLSAFAGKFVEISAVVRQTTPSRVQPRGIQWRTLKISGPEAYSRPRAAPAATSRPNIVLVVFDTLRADYTEPYGASTVQTPGFSRLAGRGTTFTDAFAHTSWTRPSVATMLTSLLEPRHGTITIGDKLSAVVPYLPEILHNAGYTTLGVSMNAHISKDWRFDRGFDSLHELGKQREQLLNDHPGAAGYVDAIWDAYVATAVGGAAPFFLYFHELDPHGPYTPRPPFDAMYPSAYSGHPEIEADHINLVRLGLTELSPQDIAHLETKYRGEVGFIDAVLGAIVDRLERDGVLDNTVLIVTSDHGEEFGEHGGIGHMVTLYDEVLRVPMIWSWPGRIRAAREASSIGLIDLSPTLLGLIGIEAPPAMSGRDLSGMLLAEGTVIEYPVLGHLIGNPKRGWRAASWAGWKLCVRDFGDESVYELYHTATDRREITNQWTTQREAGLALSQVLEWYAYSNAHLAPAATDNVPMESLDPEIVERLRNLGYVQ